MDRAVLIFTSFLVVFGVSLIVLFFFTVSAGFNEVAEKKEFCIEHNYLEYKDGSCVRWSSTDSDVLEKRKVCTFQDKIGWCDT